MAGIEGAREPAELDTNSPASDRYQALLKWKIEKERQKTEQTLQSACKTPVQSRIPVPVASSVAKATPTTKAKENMPEISCKRRAPGAPFQLQRSGNAASKGNATFKPTAAGPLPRTPAPWSNRKHVTMPTNATPQPKGLVGFPESTPKSKLPCPSPAPVRPSPLLITAAQRGSRIPQHTPPANNGPRRVAATERRPAPSTQNSRAAPATCLKKPVPKADDKTPRRATLNDRELRASLAAWRAENEAELARKMAAMTVNDALPIVEDPASPSYRRNRPGYKRPAVPLETLPDDCRHKIKVAEELVKATEATEDLDAAAELLNQAGDAKAEPAEEVKRALEDFLQRNGPTRTSDDDVPMATEPANSSVFASSVIKFAAVKPRPLKEEDCGSGAAQDAVLITPVRRSTRKTKVAASSQLCVPTMDKLDGVTVRLFPNHALDGPHNLSLAQ